LVAPDAFVTEFEQSLGVIMKKIKKAVFPVAGMGTRFLPATKANPKEMLPVVDKPLIQYAAEEAVAAGIEVLIFVTGRNKRSIPDHFDKAYELEAELEARGKTKLLKMVQDIVPPEVTCIYIRQTEALGLGHAVGCARPVIGDEPFAVVLADDLIDGEGSCSLKQMVEVHAERGCSVLGVEQVPPEETFKYGVIKGKQLADRLWDVEAMVEKPKPEDAPSNVAVVGRYILNPAIFDMIEKLTPGAGGEYQLTDAIVNLLERERVVAYQFRGKRYDCGSKLGYLQATVEYGLKHPELADEFAAYLRSLQP
jgi:UTP--glucose-1-phosphate uridylyltransferase